ncbi:MAG: hypothetical protein ACXW0Q_07155 [Methylovulum sp.]
MANDNPALIDSVTGEVVDLPLEKGTRYRAKLDTLQDVRKEAARVYREARSGLIEAQEATKLVWCLQAVGKLITESDLEKRIEALENQK